MSTTIGFYTDTQILRLDVEKLLGQITKAYAGRTAKLKEKTK